MGFCAFYPQTDLGKSIFGGAQDVVNQPNIYSTEGAKMLFGPLANRDLLGHVFGLENGLIFAVPVTATIVLIAALSALFYHWGILQKVVQVMAWVMMRVMKTSGSESLAAASNIFIGQTEAALLIRLHSANDGQRIDGVDDYRFCDDRDRGDDCLLHFQRTERRRYHHSVGDECACCIADFENHAAGNREKPNRRKLQV